ncbi:MAG: hypothetical protein AAF682_22995 [Planctomycetota bacterium]
MKSTYEERLAHYQSLAEASARRVRALGLARLATFGAGVLLLALAYGRWASWPAALGPWPGGLAFAAFVALLIVHARERRRPERAEGYVRINREALARLARRWDELPLPTPAPLLRDHPLADDLDLAGRGSLSQLLGTVQTPWGSARLARWLLVPDERSGAPARQEAVRDLTPRLDLHQDLQLFGEALADVPTEPLLEWAEGESEVSLPGALVWLCRLLAVAGLVITTLLLVGTIEHPAWLTVLLVNALLDLAFLARANRVYDKIAAGALPFERFSSLFGRLAGERFDSELARTRAAELTAGEHAASRSMARLQRIVGWSDMRFSALVYLPLIAITVWDVHVYAAFDAWRRRSGRSLRGWIDAAADLEALAALAGLARDEPEWTLPELVGEPTLRAEGLGHPLLAERVTNDVEVGPPGTCLLVTGSNMAGKSTLLRSVGLNALLGAAGGPVCARALRLPDVELATSIRVRDSLQSGVSLYMAQLLRLKEIVAALRSEDRGGRVLLFLLDEILSGTNAAERRIAVGSFVSHVLQRGATGLLATHDLTLAELPELQEVSRPVHFRHDFEEQDGEPRMRFDYVLRPGITPSVNALKLLRIVGLFDEEPDVPPSDEG